MNHACGMIQQCYRVQKLYFRYDIVPIWWIPFI
jgi:hypothetical protein